MANTVNSRVMFFDSVQAIAAIAGIASKLLLANNNIWGWVLAIMGYVLVAIYNFFYIKLKILSVVVVGLALLCAYGLVKWFSGTVGIQMLDWVIVVLTIIFSIWLTVIESKNQAPLWQLSIIVAFTTFIAWISLGLKFAVIGWFALLISHSLLFYIYARKKSWAFVVMQMISFAIAAWKLSDLF